MARRLSASPRAVARSAAKRSALQYQLRIELQHIEPLIWRRVLVPADVTLANLHLILQGAMAGTVAPSSDNARIRCIAGANACPPEDVGGPPGYFELLAAPLVGGCSSRKCPTEPFSCVFHLACGKANFMQGCPRLRTPLLRSRGADCSNAGTRLRRDRVPRPVG